jgi:hypothetical protein
MQQPGRSVRSPDGRGEGGTVVQTARSASGSGSCSSRTSAASNAGATSSPSIVDRALGPYRSVTRFLERRALVRAARAVPRTVRFLAGATPLGGVAGTVGGPRHSPGLAVGVAADEAFLAISMAPSRYPRRADYARVRDEMADAAELYSARGWIDRPATYHRAPPPLRDGDLQSSRGWAVGLGYERIAFDSGFAPRADEPGVGRWMGYEPNRRAVATVVRHPERDGPRPWLVSVHGFAMGYPSMDFLAMRTPSVHHSLGYNVVSPVLPLHGPRKVTRVSGEPFLSFDLMNSVHGFSQSVWDIRRLLSWLRAQGAESIHLYGVSLGAYVVSLLAGLEEGIDSVVAGIPMVDLPALFHELSPTHVRARSIEHHIVGGPAEAVFVPVSPLRFAPKVPHEGRYIFAGLGDRLASPEHARRLWEHWDRPPISWYRGSHVGYLWSRQVATFLEDSLATTRPHPRSLPKAG